MDWNWVFVGSGAVTAAFIGSFLGGIVIGALKDWEAGAKQAQMDKRISRLEMSNISGAGVDAKREKSERMAEVMAEVATLMANPENKGKEMDILKAMAAKHPDVALDVAKKAMRGGGLGNLAKGLMG